MQFCSSFLFSLALLSSPLNWTPIIHILGLLTMSHTCLMPSSFLSSQLDSNYTYIRPFNHVPYLPHALFFLKDFIYLFLEREDGKEKERERNINVWLPLTCPRLGTWPAIQACALTGNQTDDTFVRRPALNPLSHTSQGTFFFFFLMKSRMEVL